MSRLLQTTGPSRQASAVRRRWTSSTTDGLTTSLSSTGTGPSTLRTSRWESRRCRQTRGHQDERGKRDDAKVIRTQDAAQAVRRRSRHPVLQALPELPVAQSRSEPPRCITPRPVPRVASTRPVWLERAGTPHAQSPSRCTSGRRTEARAFPSPGANSAAREPGSASEAVRRRQKPFRPARSSIRINALIAAAWSLRAN